MLAYSRRPARADVGAGRPSRATDPLSIFDADRVSHRPIVLDRCRECDSQVVAWHAQPAVMNILLDCAGCGDEVVFSVDGAEDELVCGACNIHVAFAPDPSATFALLYEAA